MPFLALLSCARLGCQRPGSGGFGSSHCRESNARLLQRLFIFRRTQPCAERCSRRTGTSYSACLQGHGNGNIHIKSIAIDSDGTLAVSWVDRPDTGIDIRDLSGTLLRSFSTGRFAAAHLSFGQDHSLWALGWQYDEARYGEDKHDYRDLEEVLDPRQRDGRICSPVAFCQLGCRREMTNSKLAHHGNSRSGWASK